VQAPDITYQFAQAKDTAGPSFEVLSRQQSLSASANLIEILFTDLPKDRVLVLTNVSMNNNPGTTQFQLEIRAQAGTQGGALVDIVSDVVNKGASIQAGLNWQGVFYIMGLGIGETALRLFASYNSGAVANTLDVNFHGIVIPRGNAGAF